MNPIENAYNYQIKKLTEQINFLKRQNLILEMEEINPQNPNPWNFPGSEGPNGTGSTWGPYGGKSTRGRFLQDLWDAIQRLIQENPNDPRIPGLLNRFYTMEDLLRYLPSDQWNNLRQLGQQQNIDNLLDLLNWFFDTQHPHVLAIMQRALMQRAARIAAATPNLRTRISKALQRFRNFGAVPVARLIMILLLLLENIEAYGSDAIEEWLRQNENNPNPDFPSWWQGSREGLPDVVTPDSDVETPSMLPNTSPTAPELPGGGGGGFGSRPIDPTQMGM